jgi:hypothetical protein
MLPPGTGPSDQRQVEPFAALSLAIGTFGILTSWCCGVFVVVTGLAGVVIGVVSLGRIAADPGRYRGRGLAIAGITVSALGPVLMMVLVFVFAIGPAIFGPSAH